jgi:hypothetical protein
MIGTVVSPPEVMRARNGRDMVLMLQVRFADPHDVQSVQYMPQVGEDSVPVQGARVAVIDLGGVSIAIASYDTIRSVRGQGEKEIYSSDGKVKLFRLVLKASGLLFAGSTKNGKNLYDVVKALADAVKTLAAGQCVSGSTLTSSADAIAAVNTMIADLQKVLTNQPGDF